MTTQSKRFTSGSGLAVLAVLFLALTVLSSALFRGFRIDLTENQLYTLADGTRNILQGIEVDADGEGNLLIDTPPDLRSQLLREQVGIVHAGARGPAVHCEHVAARLVRSHAVAGE